MFSINFNNNEAKSIDIADDFEFIYKKEDIGIIEYLSVLKDISKLDVDIVTIGQYLRPTAKHRPIDRYAPEEEFEHYKLIGEAFGIPHVESGPLVRSSYHAKDSFASV